MSIRHLLLQLTPLLAVVLLTSRLSIAGDAPANALAGLGQAASLASVCSGCHGADTAGVAIVSLNGYSASRIRSRFLAYKDADDGRTAMHRMARGYTEQQIDMIAEQLAN